MEELPPISRQRMLYWSISVSLGILLLGVFCHDKPESSPAKRCYFNEHCTEASHETMTTQSLHSNHRVNVEVELSSDNNSHDVALLCPSPGKNDRNNVVQVLTSPQIPIVISFHTD